MGSVQLPRLESWAPRAMKCHPRFQESPEGAGEELGGSSLPRSSALAKAGRQVSSSCPRPVPHTASASPPSAGRCAQGSEGGQPGSLCRGPGMDLASFHCTESMVPPIQESSELTEKPSVPRVSWGHRTGSSWLPRTERHIFLGLTPLPSSLPSSLSLPSGCQSWLAGGTERVGGPSGATRHL